MKKRQNEKEVKRKRGRPKKPVDPNQPKPRKRKRGRPKKRVWKPKFPRRQKRRFEETAVGYYIAHEAPVEYALLMDANIIGEPSANLIEYIGYASLNPLFKKPKFRRALKEYRECGLYPLRPRKASPQVERYYMRIRKNIAD